MVVDGLDGSGYSSPNVGIGTKVMRLSLSEKPLSSQNVMEHE